MGEAGRPARATASSRPGPPTRGGGGGEDDGAEKGVELTRALILDETREEPEKATSLEFHNRQIRDTGVLEECTRLRRLDLSFNLIGSLSSMRYLKNLRELRLYNNNLESLHGVHHLTNLQVLSVDSNKLSRLEGLAGLKFLHELSAAFNELGEIEVGSLPPTLRTLDLSSNGIERLRGLEGLGKLEQLSVCDNELTDLKGLPVSPCQLKELQASGNQIRSLRGLEKYADHLDVLRLEDNQIASLAGLTRALNVVTEVFLSGNRLETLEGARNFPECEILDLGKNRVCDPDAVAELAELEELRDLKLEGNPMAAGDAAAYRSGVLERLEQVECLDDEDVESRMSRAAAPVPAPAPPPGGKPAGKPGASGARPPTPRRRSLGTARVVQAPADPRAPGARPMSARAGGGSRLLTATQYETETRAFEEQVHGYQSAMTKLLREMRKNLELPMEEVASMVKASEGEGMTDSLPEPPVIGAVRQEHSQGRDTLARSADPIAREESGNAEELVGASRRVEPPQEEQQEQQQEQRVLAVEEEEKEQEEEFGAPGDVSGSKYDFLVTEDDDPPVRTRAAGEDDEARAKEANYKGFRVPPRPLSARKSAANKKVERPSSGGAPKKKSASLSSTGNATVRKVSRLKVTSKFKPR